MDSSLDLARFILKQAAPGAPLNGPAPAPRNVAWQETQLGAPKIIDKRNFKTPPAPMKAIPVSKGTPTPAVGGGNWRNYLKGGALTLGGVALGAGLHKAFAGTPEIPANQPNPIY
jgi:hypothetical protein